MDNGHIAARFYDFADFRLDVENKNLVKQGNLVPLNHKAFGVLLFLVKNSGQTVRKEDIIEDVWSDRFVEESNLTQHIYTLRKFLDADPAAESLIKTVPKTGYKFNARVSVDPKIGRSAGKTLAVLPFRPLTESDDDKKLGLGIADALITKLSKLQQIPVRPTGSVFRYIDLPPVDPFFAGRELGVDTILQGTIQHDGEKIRLNVQLMSIDEEKNLWAESFNEDAREIFSMQDAISEKVARLLTINLSGHPDFAFKTRATGNKDAYEAYMLGVYFWNVRTREGLLKAVDYFRHAIELDGDYAQAYAGLADAYGLLAYYNYDLSDEMYALAEEAAIRAIALDPTMSEAYVALALPRKYLKNDHVNSRHLLEKAVALAPFNATAHQRLAWQLVADREIDGAVSEMRIAQEYSPLSPVVNADLAQVLILKRQFDEAKKYCEKVCEIAPESNLFRVPLADAYFFTGQAEAAIEILEEHARKHDDDLFALSRLGYFYARSGRLKHANRIYKRLIAKEGRSRIAADLASLAYALGATGKARDHLRQAIENNTLLFTAVLDPVFDELLSDSQVKKILVRQKTAESSN